MSTDNMTIRPFAASDAAVIFTWTKNKTEFRKWSADRYDSYPAKPEDMVAQYTPDNIHPLTMTDNGIPVGHIMLRIPNPDVPTSVRLGFIIVDPSIRGKGYGKQLIRLAINFAMVTFNARQITLGVFDNNLAAKHCYEACGFRATGQETYSIDGEDWTCIEMEYSVEG